MTACGKQGASLKLKRGIAVKSPGCLSSSPIETSLPPRGQKPLTTPTKQIIAKSPGAFHHHLLKRQFHQLLPLGDRALKNPHKTRISTPKELAHSPGPVKNISHVIGSSFDVLNNEKKQFPQYQDVSIPSTFVLRIIVNTL